MSVRLNYAIKYNLKMKKSFILLLFGVLLSSFGLQGQTVVLTGTDSSCSDLSVSMTGSCFRHVGAGNQAINGDWYYNTYSSKTYRVQLSKKQSDGSFAPVEPAFELSNGSSYTWSNLSQSEYRVSTSVYLCSTQRAFTTNGQLLGFRGIISPGLASNVVSVGSTQISDNVTNFLDANGMKIFPDANGNSSFFADGEEVRINTTASKNYQWYFMAIFENLPNGSPGRWRALGNGGNGGWLQEPMKPVESLTNLWNIDGGSTWTFTPGNSYSLQIALSKSNCPSWTEVVSTFYICPPGWPCRTGGEKKMHNKIVLSPNPASNKFRLNGINFADVKNCNVFISDISGREIQRFKDVNTNEFALNGLSNGIYIVNITADNRRLFSNKLVVNN